MQNKKTSSGTQTGSVIIIPNFLEATKNADLGYIQVRDVAEPLCRSTPILSEQLTARILQKERTAFGAVTRLKAMLRRMWAKALRRDQAAGAEAAGLYEVLSK